MSQILGNPLDLPRWWPAVYLEVVELRAPNGEGIGRRVRVLTKGKLPYRLRWEIELVESRYPYGFAIEANGDFEGTGTWTFAQSVDTVDVVFDWQIRAEKPMLRWLSFVFKPISEANHRWAMARGEEGLVRKLAHRRRGV